MDDDVNYGDHDIGGGDEINLREYIRVLIKNKWTIALITALTTALALGYVTTSTPIYKATSTLLIEGDKNNVVSIQELYGFDASDTDYFQTQFEILKSRELAEKIVEKLGLTTHPDFTNSSQFDIIAAGRELLGMPPVEGAVDQQSELLSAMDPDMRRRFVAGQFLSRLSVEPIRKTKLVRLGFESPDPVFAAHVANSVGEIYIEDYLDAKAEMTEKAADWLTERLSVLKVALQESEEKLQAYKEETGLVDFGGGVSRFTEQELANFSNKLVDAQREEAEAEALFNEVQRLRATAPDVLENLPAVQASSLVQTYKVDRAEVEREIDELSNRYGDRHPRMVDARSRLGVIERNLELEIQRIISSIQKDYELAQSNVRTLEQRVASGKQEIQSIGRKSFELDQLQREVDANRNLYETFFNRFRETDEASSLDSTNARISDAAVPPLFPAKPKKSMIVALGFILGLIVSVAIAFLREYLDDTVVGADQIESKLGLPLLGILPKLKLKKATELPLNPDTIVDDRGSFAESIRTIRTSITLGNADGSDKLVIITSSVPNEGKSTLSVNLAHSMAEMDKVLLIDADMRRPSVHKTLGLPIDSPGLVNLVEKTARAADCIYKDLLGSLDVMPAGGVPANPLELISSKRFGYLLEQLRKHYDRIVIDCPPVQAVSDALVLSRHADSVLYVVRSGETPFPVAQRGVRRMQQIGASVKGLIVSQVDIEKLKSHGGDHYYQGYYDYYGYSEGSAAAKKKVVDEPDDFSTL
ncbi:MAG: polysaccharide biosynthesis tyrosine autokinase [Pseudomonadota bacterium]